MAKVTVRKETGKLVIDFTYRGVRCREQTILDDTKENRKRVQAVIDKVQKAIKEGTFLYRDFFPQSALAARFDSNIVIAHAEEPSLPVSVGPTFNDYAATWVAQHSIEWRRSHIRSLLSTLHGRLIPHFGNKGVGSITKSDILDYRATLAKVKGRNNKDGLSPKRINEIMGLLSRILNEAADDHKFTSPALKVKKLKEPKTDVQPFNLNQVQSIIAASRSDYKNYFVTRFFTGMRTGEVHGLQWQYVDFDLRIIRVRETFVLGEDEYTKTDGSQRDIQMSQPVFDALKAQFEVTGKVSKYVFCNLEGAPIDNKNFSDRVWYPLLRHLGLKERRPYQMRHTAATLWLASGEAPEWVANQLGHANTQMLFTIYSRFVPNLTRQDGSAMERLLASKMAQGPLVEHTDPAGQSSYVPVAETAPMPIPKPRGIYGNPTGRSKAELERKAQIKTHADITDVQVKDVSRGVPKEVLSPSNAGRIREIHVGPATAQPPPTQEPLSWADMASNWLQGEQGPPRSPPQLTLH